MKNSFIVIFFFFFFFDGAVKFAILNFILGNRYIISIVVVSIQMLSWRTLKAKDLANCCCAMITLTLSQYVSSICDLNSWPEEQGIKSSYSMIDIALINVSLSNTQDMFVLKTCTKY